MKIGVIHATMNAVEPLMAVFKKNAPETTVLNFLNENLLFRANAVGGADYKGLRAFTKLVFEAVDAEVDGIIVACSVFCPFVPLMRNFTDIPMIAIDNPMLERAVNEGKKIGILATTAPSAPSAKRQLEKMAAEENKTLEFDMEIITDAMVALKAGDVEKHNEIIAEAGKRLVERGCDTLVLSQITMACAAEKMKNFGVNVLSSPEEGYKKIVEMVNKNIK